MGGWENVCLNAYIVCVLNRFECSILESVITVSWSPSDPVPQIRNRNTRYMWTCCAPDSEYNVTNLNETITGPHSRNNAVITQVTMRAVAVTGLKYEFPPRLPSPSDCPFRAPHVEFKQYRGRLFR